MGNSCCRRESAMVWASGDELYDPSIEKESLVVLDDVINYRAASTPLKVKIRVTKRELEEMVVAIARMQDVPVDQFLSRLIQAVDHSGVQPQRSWEPVLDTIAE